MLRVHTVFFFFFTFSTNDTLNNQLTQRLVIFTQFFLFFLPNFHMTESLKASDKAWGRTRCWQDIEIPDHPAQILMYGHPILLPICSISVDLEACLWRMKRGQYHEWLFYSHCCTRCSADFNFSNILARLHTDCHFFFKESQYEKGNVGLSFGLKFILKSLFNNWHIWKSYARHLSTALPPPPPRPTPSSNKGLTLQETSRFSFDAQSWEPSAVLHKQSGRTWLSSDILSKQAARQQISFRWSLMTGISVTGICGLKWFSRCPSPPPHLPLSHSHSCVWLECLNASSCRSSLTAAT